MDHERRFYHDLEGHLHIGPIISVEEHQTAAGFRTRIIYGDNEVFYYDGPLHLLVRDAYA